MPICQGTVCEMLKDPARASSDVIRWFGERGKLLNVHFHDIKGRRLDASRRFPTKAISTWPARSPPIGMSATDTC